MGRSQRAGGDSIWIDTPDLRPHWGRCASEVVAVTADADIVREALEWASARCITGTDDYARQRDALAALDRLVAERGTLVAQAEALHYRILAAEAGRHVAQERVRLYVSEVEVAVARAEAAEAERDEARASYEKVRQAHDDAIRWNDKERLAAEAEVQRLREALDVVAAQQPKTLAMIEANGCVFTDIGKEPGNWQHIAFSIYTDLCEVDTLARAALGKEQT
jgi:hypothetical protein